MSIAPLSGMQASQAQVERSASRIAGLSSGGSQPAEDSVDLSHEMVSLLQGRDDFAVNLKALAVMDEMAKSTFSMLA